MGESDGLHSKSSNLTVCTIAKSEVLRKFSTTKTSPTPAQGFCFLTTTESANTLRLQTVCTRQCQRSVFLFTSQSCDLTSLMFSHDNEIDDRHSKSWNQTVCTPNSQQATGPTSNQCSKRIRSTGNEDQRCQETSCVRMLCCTT